MQTDKKKRGPRKRRVGSSKPRAFYKMCLEKLPNHLKQNVFNPEKGSYLDVPLIASQLKIRRQTFYIWVKQNSVPPNQIEALLGLPGSEMTLEDIRPFAPLLPFDFIDKFQKS